MLEEIFALIELALDGTAKNLPRLLHTQALRLLVPAEAALRRLIVVVARGVEVKLPPKRPMPQGKVIVKNSAGPKNFILFDRRKVFSNAAPRIVWTPPEPRIHFIDYAPLVPSYTKPKAYRFNTKKLLQRYAVFKNALETIPHQAKRMALWQLRRAQTENTKFKKPLRPGRAPGSRLKPIFTVDHILKRCHELAFDAERTNTS